MEIEFQDKDFIKLTNEEILKIFTEHKNISVYFNDQRFDLAYVNLSKNKDAIILSHVKRLPKTYIDDNDEERYTKIFSVELNPLFFKRAVNIFIRYYNNTKKGKRTIIKAIDKL